MRIAAVALVALLSSCGGNFPPSPPDPPDPEPCSPGQGLPTSCERETEDPRACNIETGTCDPCVPDLSGAIWNTDAGEVTCSTEERPVKHWPPNKACPMLTEPCASPPELPQPQCPTFTDRGGTLRVLDDACDCYIGEELIECPTEPPTQGCVYPEIDDSLTTPAPSNPGTMGSIVNKAMADLTGCFVGQEPCPISVPEDVWFTAVCEKLREGGYCCGRHIDVPPGEIVCPPGAGCTDQISVKREDFCDGKPHENYRVINAGQDGVRWFPSAKLDAWNVVCVDTPPPTEPPGDCCPIPEGCTTEFNLKRHGGLWDSTYVYGNCLSHCECIGYFCMPNSPCNCNIKDDPGCIPRAGPCPIEAEGNPNRPACEFAVIGHQQWWCNGQPIPNSGNPAQAVCTGHVKTCTEDGVTCGEADW